MRTTLRTRRNLVGAAGLVATLGLVVGPVSAAQAATTGHVVSIIPVPTHTYSALATGLGSVWLADTDENSFATVIRINPTTNRVTGSTTLDIGAGGFAVGYGSLWVAGWATNTVERIDPSTMHVTARIRTKLGPEALVAAFGSIWVGNHHDHAISRIDPATNKVVATYTVGIPNAFRDGPGFMTADSRFVYVGVANTASIYRIDPRTNRVSGSLPSPSDCGGLAAAGGTVWSTDPCADTLTSVSFVTHTTLSFGYDPGVVTSDVMRNGVLWVAYDKAFDPDTGNPIEGSLDARDPVTGELLGTIAVGGDASNVASGFGSLWTYDPGAGTVTRVAVSG